MMTHETSGLDQHMTEAYRQLNDDKTYKKLIKDPTKKNNALITNLLKQWERRGFTDTDTMNGLIIKHPKTACLYLLLKIHKPNVPGRPIIAAINKPTAGISAFVDYHIKRLAQAQPSYIRDTKDFLNFLNRIAN